MSGIGPELPPHILAKRKRKLEEDVKNDHASVSGAKRSSSPEGSEKRRRVVGPALPPAPIDQRPPHSSVPPSESESDDGDGFGPALPAQKGSETGENTSDQTDRTSEAETESIKPRRDEWMTMAPKQDDLAARLDPTRQRPRTFNTGKGARGANDRDEDSSAWHETPEQKQKRLADEMMGIAPSAGVGPQKPAPTARDESTIRQIRERTESTRGPSLVDRHQARVDREPDDDPSKRAFDREKDMGSGVRIDATKRKELLGKAAGFSSKFSSGTYL